MTIIKKVTTTTLGLTLLTISFLTGCSASPEASEQQLSKEMVNTVCLLKDKSVVTDEDITAFRDLAAKMYSYSGTNASNIHEAASQVDSIANTYDTAVGKDMGTEAAEQHTTACNSLTKEYEEKYGK
jgi:hypothetical protein